MTPSVIHIQQNWCIYEPSDCGSTHKTFTGSSKMGSHSKQEAIYNWFICWQREKNQFSSMEHPWVYQPCPGVVGQHNMNSMFLLLIFLLFFMDFLFHFGIFLLYLTFIFNLFDFLVFIVLWKRKKEQSWLGRKVGSGGSLGGKKTWSK